MSARGRHADANACGTCRKAVEAGDTVVHEECAARASLLQAPDYPDYEDLIDLSDDERQALPARFHTPQFDSLGKPNAWLCRVCWGDGWVTQWPCKAAQENGTQVFTHAFVDDAMNELAALRSENNQLRNDITGACLARYEEEQENARLLKERHSTNEALDDAVRELAALRARVAELETERKKYVGVEPTVAEELAYVNRCLNAVYAVCDAAEKQATRWENPLPVPEWVALVRNAADGVTMRAPALPPVPQQRQTEDPHSSELHHDYALGRNDLRFIPHQTTGRCPVCRGTFEDCTCGGAA